MLRSFEDEAGAILTVEPVERYEFVIRIGSGSDAPAVRIDRDAARALFGEVAFTNRIGA